VIVKILKNSSLVTSLVLLNQKSHYSVNIFYIMLLFIFMIITSVNYFSPVQSLMMKKFHVGALPFNQWVLCQFVPSMYNFNNEIIISSRLLASDFNDSQSKDQFKCSVNHYPMRIIYYSHVRSSFFAQMPFYVYLRSSYGSRQIVSVFRIESSPTGARPIRLNFYEHVKN